MTRRERPSESRVECSRPVTGRETRGSGSRRLALGGERCILYNDPGFSLGIPEREGERNRDSRENEQNRLVQVEPANPGDQ